MSGSSHKPVEFPTRLIRVLVVDQDPETAKLIMTQLPYQAWSYENGNNAMRFLISNQSRSGDDVIDLVIWDNNVPEINGLGALDIIRSRVSNNLPVVIMSDTYVPNVDMEVRERGACVLMKPVTEQDVTDLQRHVNMSKLGLKLHTGDERLSLYEQAAEKAFVTAIKKLGGIESVDAVPSNILKLMEEVKITGLTITIVTNRLQNYRKELEKKHHSKKLDKMPSGSRAPYQMNNSLPSIRLSDDQPYQVQLQLKQQYLEFLDRVSSSVRADIASINQLQQIRTPFAGDDPSVMRTVQETSRSYQTSPNFMTITCEQMQPYLQQQQHVGTSQEITRMSSALQDLRFIDGPVTAPNNYLPPQGHNNNNNQNIQEAATHVIAPTMHNLNQQYYAQFPALRTNQETRHVAPLTQDLNLVHDPSTLPNNKNNPK